MKKVLLSVFLAFVCLSLASCFKLDGDDTIKNSFFSEEYLTELSLSEIPAPHLSDSRLDGDTLYLNMTKDSFSAYVEQVHGYLSAREDIYHLSEHQRSEIFGLLLIPFKYHLYAPTVGEYDTEKNEHRLAFSTTEEIHTESSISEYMLKGAVTVSLTYGEGRIEKADFDYNTKITLKKDRHIYLEEYAFYLYSLEKAYGKLHPETEDAHFRYIGRYGYATVAVIEGAKSVERETVGEHTFDYTDGCKIVVHYYNDYGLDDKIMTLTELYEEELLSDRAIEEIYKIFTETKEKD